MQVLQVSNLWMVFILGVLCILPIFTKYIFRQWFDEKQKFMERLANLSVSVPTKYEKVH